VLLKKEGEEKVEKKGAAAKDEWELVEPSGMELENVGGFASTFANARAEEFLDKLPGADARALDKAYKITATIVKDGKGSETSLMLGAGRKKGVYARVGGEKGVVLISKYSAKQLMKSLGDFRKKKLFSFKAEDIEELIVESGLLPKMHLKKSGSDWSFVEPAGESASKSKVKSMASGIANLRAAEFLDSRPASETGLDETALKVTARLTSAAGSGSSTILIGREYKNAEDQERFYAMQDGKSQLFGIMKYSRENVAKTVEELRDKRVFKVSKEDIQEITITHPDETLRFVKEDKDGKPVWNMTAPKAKKGVSLTSIASTLASLDVEKTVTGKKPEEVGLDKDTFSLSFKLKDGTVHSITFSEEVEDNKNYAVTPTVESLKDRILMISKYKVQNLAKKLPDFEKKPGGPPAMPGGMMMPH